MSGGAVGLCEYETPVLAARGRLYFERLLALRVGWLALTVAVLAFVSVASDSRAMIGPCCAVGESKASWASSDALGGGLATSTSAASAGGDRATRSTPARRAARLS